MDTKRNQEVKDNATLKLFIVYLCAITIVVLLGL